MRDNMEMGALSAIYSSVAHRSHIGKLTPHCRESSRAGAKRLSEKEEGNSRCHIISSASG
jgi:hypothetical protein